MKINIDLLSYVIIILLINNLIPHWLFIPLTIISICMILLWIFAVIIKIKLNIKEKND